MTTVLLTTKERADLKKKNAVNRKLNPTPFFPAKTQETKKRKLFI